MHGDKEKLKWLVYWLLIASLKQKPMDIFSILKGSLRKLLSDSFMFGIFVGVFKYIWDMRRKEKQLF